ncbi:MAG: hypothetical protein Q8S54_14275 [Bacteroidota bacterium]|nr:hypothetical protein [Bacteroidota bacterium]
MDNNKFDKFYSSKSVSELIIQLRTQRITGSTIDKEWTKVQRNEFFEVMKWHEGLKSHLSRRVLSAEARKMVDHILSSDPETLRKEVINQQELNDLETTNQSLSFSTEKYPALRIIARLLTVYAWIAGIVTLIIATNFGIKSEGSIIVLPVIVIGALNVLGTLAVSGLIKVVIDIEFNTRQKANEK